MAGAISQASREAILAWFVEFQKTIVVKNGIVPEWFHGIISRKESEELLMTKPPGYFLIRVSESRIGYTLSYRAEDRCRHFMVDMLPGNQYVIVGEKIHHRSLHDLVAFHRRCPIRPYVEVLTVACGQVSKDNTDYAELLFSKRHVHPPGTDDQSSSPRPEPNIPQDPRPAQPSCPPLNKQSSGMPLAAQSANPTRLYPSLDTELAALNIQDKTSPPRPVAKSRAKHLDTPPPLPPQLPPRSSSPQSSSQSTAGADRKKGPPAAYIQRPLPSPQPEDKDSSQRSSAEAKSARISLAQCKKIFQKKKNHEEHTYIEVNEHQIGKPGFPESNQQELSGDADDPEEPEEPSEEAVGALPIEYLNPPPFAPGF